SGLTGSFTRASSPRVSRSARKSSRSSYIGVDLIGNLLRQRQGAAPLLAGHERRALALHRVDEVHELAPERLLAGHRELAALDGRHGTIPFHQLPDLDLLRRVVDRQIRRRLKEPDLADAVAADAAGRHVGDAAVREPDARVRDVDARRDDGNADGLE